MFDPFDFFDCQVRVVDVDCLGLLVGLADVALDLGVQFTVRGLWFCNTPDAAAITAIYFVPIRVCIVLLRAPALGLSLVRRKHEIGLRLVAWLLLNLSSRLGQLRQHYAFGFFLHI